VRIALAWLALRRGKPRRTRAAAAVDSVALIGWLVAVRAMGAKPS
jgi:hypothetical protein